MRLLYNFRKNRSLFLMGLPGILFLLVFSYLPMLGIFVAFKDFNYAKGIFNSDWVGLKNFQFFFNAQNAWPITRNTLLLNAAFIIFTTVMSVIVALMLAERGNKAVKLYQTILFLPFFISWVVASYGYYALFSADYGAINNILNIFGLKEVIWYQEIRYWPAILILASFWKSGGYYILLFYSSLIGIDPGLYEAAAIDGANKIQRVRYISIPLLMPVITMLVLLAIGRIFFADFGLFFFLPRNSGVLYPVTDVIDTYVFRALRIQGNFGMASAAAFYQSMVGFVLILISNWLVRKLKPEMAIF